MNFMSKRQEQRRSQFQGSKKKARKLAYQEREKNRHERMQSLLPTVYKDPVRIPSVPVINAVMSPMFFDYEVKDREKGPNILLVD